MPERPQPPPDAERLLQLKDGIKAQWKHLPPEHQATMALVLLETVIGSEWGPWVREAVELRWAAEADPAEKLFPITSVSRADMLRAGVSQDQIETMSDEDMRRIARLMEDYYVMGAYWCDLELAAGNVLQGKEKGGEAGSGSQ